MFCLVKFYLTLYIEADLIRKLLLFNLNDSIKPVFGALYAGIFLCALDFCFVGIMLMSDDSKSTVELLFKILTVPAFLTITSVCYVFCDQQEKLEAIHEEIFDDMSNYKTREHFSHTYREFMIIKYRCSVKLNFKVIGLFNMSMNTFYQYLQFFYSMTVGIINVGGRNN